MQRKKLKGMKRCILEKVVMSFTLGILILFSVLFKGGASAKILDKIVAVVNGDIITLSELKKISDPYLEKMQSKYSLDYDEAQIEETEKRILDQLIDEKLIKQEVAVLKIVVEEKEVDMALRDIMEESKLSEDKFEQALIEEGFTLEKYREQLKDQMEKMRLLDQEVKSKIEVKEKEIEHYYKEHKDRFEAPPEVRLQQILLMIPPEANEQEISQIREKAEGIVQRIKGGEDFNTMARLYSQDSSAAIGGDIGFFKQGELLPALGEAAFSLNKGEISSVIKTSSGFHIIRVLEKRDKQKMPKEERFKEIKGIIYNQKVDDKSKQWLKELRKKSYIKINL